MQESIVVAATLPTPILMAVRAEFMATLPPPTTTILPILLTGVSYSGKLRASAEHVVCIDISQMTRSRMARNAPGELYIWGRSPAGPAWHRDTRRPCIARS